MLSVSTSSCYRSRFVCAIAVVLASAGCGPRRAALAPPLRGSVNLVMLIRQHPGWSGLGQYDAALTRLESVSRQLPLPGQPDAKLGNLPALAPAAGFSTAVTPGELTRVGNRLGAVQSGLLGGLRQRRDQERQKQLRQEGELREREAARLFPFTAGSSQGEPDLDLQLLQASVDALTRTVGSWDQSKPPAPALEALRLKVARDRARLEALLAERVRSRVAAATEQQDAIQSVLRKRAIYAQAQQAALEARLTAEDAELIALQKERLTQERLALLQALTRPDPLFASADGNAGSVTLPRGAGIAPASVSEASLMASEVRLRLQRARWLRFLEDDTAAAAKDTAQGRRWDVTFGPPRPGDRDLTAQMAQALAAGIWRL